MKTLKKITETIRNMYHIFGYNSRKESIKDIGKNYTKLLMDLNGKDYDLALSQLFCSVVDLLDNEGISIEQATETASQWLKDHKQFYVSIGRRERIGIIGGSFDPFTNGHLAMGKVLLAAGVVDRILYMVANNHAEKKNQTPAKQRLHMVNLALKHEHAMSVSSFEIDNDLGGQTHFITKKILQDKQFHGTEPYLVLGADVANSYMNWPDASLQERLFPCIILPRKGYELRFHAWYNSPIHTVLEDADIIGISSTQVRNVVAQGNSELVKTLINQNLWTYIKKKKLYGYKAKKRNV